ncbi:crosslink repair DNA glycosylase YcaQ family protein [uncultured Stenotrophomonas sp.]|uniref:DNA glycosylase AlkZ-like family protein n=1 Tax=uncultured Stenotrophomonas sp. TaxID=165438 RepID=UPI0025EE9154|nr:crosslink repair DNA glycosylase YcaQ family protein [uncultured Stenotrophomonas sp.]
MKLTLDHLRRYAVARTLFKPTTLMRAIAKLGFVQADPIRAPARAQDLTLRHRVLGYRAGDLERRYPRLPIEEDFFVNYGFLPRDHQALMHPRQARMEWTTARWKQAQAVQSFIAERGAVHPREVDAHFAHGKTTNWFGGSSNASTQLLDGMHYRGLLRVARRDGGTRVYAVRDAALAVTAAEIDARMDALIDLIVGKYAPLPDASLGQLVAYLGNGVPQWKDARKAALARARLRLQRARVDGTEWVWPAYERAESRRWKPDNQVRLLTPFDPVVWDRRRFELLWGWAYRFEAYTPPAKRKLGYYALPLLWGDRVIGWGNLSVAAGALNAQLQYVDGRAPRDAGFVDGLDAELGRMRVFLGLDE